MHRLLLLVELCISSTAIAQTLPPVRPLGRPTGVTGEALRAGSQVLELSDKRVLVNDNVGRRLVLFDSSLLQAVTVADTSTATQRAYGSLGGLIDFRGDSSLLVDPAALSMSILDRDGRMTRTIAIPNPQNANYLIGGPFGTPGVDSLGRLVSMSRIGGFIRVVPTVPSGQKAPPAAPDSGLVTRIDLVTHRGDTVSRFLIPSVTRVNSVDNNRWVTMRRIVNPLPLTDDWALLSDGRIAIVRGREYRVEIFSLKGGREVSVKLPFAWQRLSEADKQAILDSARLALSASQSASRANTQRAEDSSLAVRRGTAAAQAGGARVSSGPARATNVTQVDDVVPAEELPDYRPPFRLGAARGDLDGNLWIRTSFVSELGPVYDIIDRTGRLIDRIAVPRGRVIVGFGRNATVYTSFLDGQVARIERAQWR